MGGGDRSARAGDVQGPAELQDLAIAFDQMAESVARQETVRRNLVADVAHELRTPVAVLQAGHEALLDGVTEPTPEQLGSLRDEVLRLARMVDDLQRLAAAEAAALQLTLIACDLAEIAGTAADRLAGAFDAADITVDRQLSSVQVMGDPGRLHEVIGNLLTNALKFTPAGGSVLVQARPADQRALLRVRDSGAGIPPDELPHIFDRFFRGRGAAGVARQRHRADRGRRAGPRAPRAAGGEQPAGSGHAGHCPPPPRVTCGAARLAAARSAGRACASSCSWPSADSRQAGIRNRWPPTQRNATWATGPPVLASEKRSVTSAAAPHSGHGTSVSFCIVRTVPSACPWPVRGANRPAQPGAGQVVPVWRRGEDAGPAAAQMRPAFAPHDHHKGFTRRALRRA